MALLPPLSSKNGSVDSYCSAVPSSNPSRLNSLFAGFDSYGTSALFRVGLDPFDEDRESIVDLLAADVGLIPNSGRGQLTF